MSLEENFTCPICLEFAKNAVEAECCTKIFCEKCIVDNLKKFGTCPCCRATKITWHPSKIARKVISEIKVPCDYCEEMVESGALEAHQAKCPKVPLACKICKQKMNQELIPKHTATLHQKQAKDYLIAYAMGFKNKTQSKIEKVQQKQVEPSSNYFVPTKNRVGLKATLGNVSKYYCGGKMLGSCFCCNGQCGPDNGQNCDACMQLDVKRWNLDKGYLINTFGCVCQVLRVQGIIKVACFRVLSAAKSNNIFTTQKINDCRPGNPCQNCAQVQNSINIGRYTGLY